MMMEFCPGGDLGTYVKEHGPLDIPAILGVPRATQALPV